MYQSRPILSVRKPDPATANPFYMSENDLNAELHRLEDLLRAGDLPADQAKRLQDVRQNLDKLRALKTGKSAPATPVASRRSIQCRAATHRIA